MKTGFHKWMAIAVLAAFVCSPLVAETSRISSLATGENALVDAPESDQQLCNGGHSNMEIGPETDSYTRRFPISINGNDDFTARNGVVAGDGTQENPYVIEGWKLTGNLFWRAANNLLSRLEKCKIVWLRKWAQTVPVCGIFLRDTDKHILIRHNHLSNWRTGGIILPSYVRTYDSSGIVLTNAHNVTIENNTIVDNKIGVYIANIHENRKYESTNITIRYNNFRNNGDLAIRAYYTSASSICWNNFSENGGGIHGFYSRLNIAYNTVVDCGNGIDSCEGSHFIINNNYIAGNGNGVYCSGGRQYIRNNTFHDNMAGVFISPARQRPSPTISNNTITNNGYGIMSMGMNGITIIVENVISHNRWNGISIGGSARIEHNLVSSNDGGGIVTEDNVSISHNIITSNGEFGIGCHPTGEACIASVHYNNIFDNHGEALRNMENKWSPILNATHNYWGSLDGPGGHGSGHGDEIDTNVLYEPWLTEPNPDAGPR